MTPLTAGRFPLTDRFLTSLVAGDRSPTLKIVKGKATRGLDATENIRPPLYRTFLGGWVGKWQTSVSRMIRAYGIIVCDIA